MNFKSTRQFRSFLFTNGLMAIIAYDSQQHQYQVSKVESRFIQSAEEILKSLPSNMTIRNKVVATMQSTKEI